MLLLVLIRFLLLQLVLILFLGFGGPEEIETATHQVLLVVCVEGLRNAAQHKDYHDYDASCVTEEFRKTGIGHRVSFSES